MALTKIVRARVRNARDIMGFRGCWSGRRPRDRRICKGGARRPGCRQSTRMAAPVRCGTRWPCPSTATTGAPSGPTSARPPATRSSRGAFAYVRADKAGDLPVAEPGSRRRGRPRHEPRLAEPRPRRPRAWRCGRRPATWPTRSPPPACASASCPTTCGAASCVPPLPDGRGGLYLGTGGPGHLDPRRNDGVRRQPGHRRDPGVGGAALRAFDAVHAHPDAALLGICHTFGVMCRWLGVADARAARPREGRQERRHRRERADAGGRRASLVRRLARRAERRARRRASASSTAGSTT